MLSVHNAHAPSPCLTLMDRLCCVLNIVSTSAHRSFNYLHMDSNHPMAVLLCASIVNLELLMLYPWNYQYFPMAPYLPGYPTPR